MNQIFGVLWGITLLYLYPKCGMTAEIWRIPRAAKQAITSGSNLIQIVVSTVFSSSEKQPTLLGFKFEFAALVQSMALLFFTVSLQNLPLRYHFLYWKPMPSLQWGQGRRPPLTTACASPVWFIQNAVLEHRVTTRQQAIMEKGIIIFKHDSRLKFSRCLQNCWPPTALHKCDPITRLINTPYRCVAE